MTNMATMPIYGQNLYTFFFFGTRSPMMLKLGMDHEGLKVYKVFYIWYDTGLTLTFYTERSNLVKIAYCALIYSGERLQDHWPSGLKKQSLNRLPSKENLFEL